MKYRYVFVEYANDNQDDTTDDEDHQSNYSKTYAHSEVDFRLTCEKSERDGHGKCQSNYDQNHNGLKAGRDETNGN